MADRLPGACAIIGCVRTVAAGLVVLIATASAAVTADARTVLVIRVKSVQTSSVDHDKPPTGLSAGDVIVQRDRLVNIRRLFERPAGAVVGSDLGTLRVLGPTRGVVTGTATFPDGTVKVKGTISLTTNASVSIPVVGGTGKYAHAHGTYVEPPTGNPAGELNVYKLVLP